MENEININSTYFDVKLRDSFLDRHIGPSESEIKEMFSRFGIVMKVNLKPARDQFSSKCWVTMKSQEEAKLALQEMGTQFELGGSRVKMIISRSQKE